MIAYHLFAVCLLIGIPFPAQAADSSVPLIKSVIHEQLKAFNNDDYDSAYQKASKHIRSEFSRTEFETMVRRGYNQIASSREATFGNISFSENGTRAVAMVTIVGTDQVTVIARYKLVWEGKKWKIDGVSILEMNRPI